jgi:dUTP pyrophosphatase
MEILIKRLHDQAVLPSYPTGSAPGIDLHSSVEVTIDPGVTMLVPTGIAMAISIGYVGRIWSRNGVATTDSVKVSASMIDSGYRSEITVELTNKGSDTVTISAGENIAQMLIQQIFRAHIIEAEDLSNSDGEEG